MFEFGCCFYHLLLLHSLSTIKHFAYILIRFQAVFILILFFHSPFGRRFGPYGRGTKTDDAIITFHEPKDFFSRDF